MDKAIENAKIMGQLITEPYDITIGQIKEIRQASGSDVYDLIMNAYYFGFYQGMNCINREKQKEKASS